MKIFATIEGYTLFDIHKRNEEFSGELATEPVDGELRGYKTNWLRRVTRMDSNRMVNVMLNCGQSGRRRLRVPFEETIRRGRNRHNW